MKGFTIYCAGKDFFYPTERTRRTDALAQEVAQAILNHLGHNVAPTRDTTEFVKLRLTPCIASYSKLSNGRTVVHFTNDTMGICGFVDDGDTVILKGEV